MLDRHHASHGKTATVARTVDLVNDRCLDIAAPQEIGMQGVRPAIFDGVVRGRQRLPDNLSAEDLGAANVAALAAKDVVVYAFEFEKLDDVFQNRVHVPPISRRLRCRR